MKKRKYILIGVAILLVVSILSIRTINFNVTSVKQDNKDYSEGTSDQCNENELYSKYKPTISKISDSQYQISISGDHESVNDAEFKVKSITKGTYNGDINLLDSITKGKNLVLNITPETNGKAKIVTVEIKLVKSSDGCAGSLNEESGFVTDLSSETQGSAIEEDASSASQTEPNSNIGTGKICTNFINGIYNKSQFSSSADFTKYNYSAVNDEGKNFYKEFIEYCWQSNVPLGTNYTETEMKSMITDAMNTWKIYSTTIDTTTPSFNTEFETIKTNAKNSGNSQENSSNLKLNYSLKCNYKVDKNSTDYYQNKTYYYASKEVDAQQVKYTYNYAPGDKQEETKDVCKRTCEEAVKVEYGPPVASKAGLCFEYKVKVTSYVKCNSTINTNAKPKSPTYCTPAPGCNNGVPGYYRQAGPSEEFEQCIQECDGGKYTAKCSNKCYKKVYGSSTNKLSLDYQNQYTIQNLANNNGSCADTDGCYYWSGNSIHWSKGTSEFGRWYKKSGYCTNCTAGDGAAGSYYADSDGIRRANYGNGSVCQDSCWWEGCSKGKYLNPAQAAADTKANNKAYSTAVTQCKASATCTSKTAEFTISIKYDTKSGNKTTINEINYPYSSNKDSLSSKGSGNEGLNTSTNDNSTILQYGGCYDSSDAKRWYMTEWSFPGTWINNKTGEISFKSKDGKGWYSEKDKFCMPLDAQSVNTKWWEWTTRSNSCQTEEAVKNELNKDYNNDNNSNGYNIKATTKNFGYFGWNFDIQCFYALRNEVCNLDNNGCCDNSCTGSDCDSTIITPSEGYTVRTVDRANLFPNSEASPTLDSANVQKREIGFNWTDGATVKSYKNEGYTVDPVALIDQIQKTSATLYDEEPDYKFTLTTENLANIRKYNKANDFGKWNGNTTVKNGIITYDSTFLGDSQYIGNNGKRGEIGVNNE